MAKRHYLIAIGSFLLIPAVAILGARLAIFIDPEWAAGHPDYESNYRLLDLAKHAVMLSTLLGIVGLWLLTCFLVIKSKARSRWWLLLAPLGPFGFIPLSMLGDTSQDRGASPTAFPETLNIYLRAGYEACLFLAVWALAFLIVDLKRDLMIDAEAARSGLSRGQIVEIQDASSGMWAFSEGLEGMYLVVLLYLLWPLCLGLVRRLAKPALPHGR